MQGYCDSSESQYPFLFIFTNQGVIFFVEYGIFGNYCLYLGQ